MLELLKLCGILTPRVPTKKQQGKNPIEFQITSRVVLTTHRFEYVRHCGRTLRNGLQLKGAFFEFFEKRVKNYKTAPHHLSRTATLPRCNTEAVSLFDFSMTYERRNTI